MKLCKINSVINGENYYEIVKILVQNIFKSSLVVGYKCVDKKNNGITNQFISL